MVSGTDERVVRNQIFPYNQIFFTICGEGANLALLGNCGSNSTDISRSQPASWIFDSVLAKGIIDAHL